MGHASLEVGSSMPCIVIRLPWGAMVGPGGKALGALNAWSLGPAPLGLAQDRLTHPSLKAPDLCSGQLLR